MTWEEYLPLAEKTLSTQFHISDDLFNQKLLHAVIGVLTEVEEILDNYDDAVLVTDSMKQGSIGEEIADVAWYLSILYRELKITENITIDYDTSEKNPFKVLLQFTKTSLSFLDLLKKKIYYNKDLDDSKAINLTQSMWQQMMIFCHIYQLDFPALLDKNISKLRSRYGDKFTSEKAINRDLDTEKKILES